MKTQMTPRERVVAALNHQEPDRVPLDLGGAIGDGITSIAYRNLRRHLGLPDTEIKIQHKFAQEAWVDEDVATRLRLDFRRIDYGAPDHWPDKQIDERTYADEYGVVRTMPVGGYYYDLTGPPFVEDATLSAIRNYPWPDPEDPGRFRGMLERARYLARETDFAVVGNLNCSFFNRCFELRGWENFFMDLVANVEFAEALMDTYLDGRLRMAEIALEQIGEYLDVVVVSSDDLGMIDRTIVSPSVYRKLVKPRMKRSFDFFRERTDAKLYLHCDGAIYPFLQDLVDIGVDCLNPIQVSASGMNDTAKMKREYGDRLNFVGGIDTQYVLPKGTPGEVREEVRRRIRDMAPGGGYVVCSVHNIQPEVPPENVVAMFDSANELGHYPIQLS